VITGVPGAVPSVWNVPVSAVEVPAPVVSVTLYVYVVYADKPKKIQLAVATVEVGQLTTVPDGDVSEAVYVTRGTLVPRVPCDQPSVACEDETEETTGVVGAVGAAAAVNV